MSSYGIYDNGRKKSYDYSNVERVKPGSDNAFLINGESYVFGPNAKIKYDTNSIIRIADDACVPESKIASIEEISLEMIK